MEGEEEGTSTKDARKFKRICVFCGSRTGYKPSFTDAALQLGKQLVINTIHKYIYIIELTFYYLTRT